MRGAAVGAPAGPLEPERGEVADAVLRKARGVRCGIGAAQHQHRQAFAPLQVIAHERAEAELAWGVRRDVCSLGNRDQFDKGLPELDDPVLGSPGVAVAWPDLKAKASVKIGGPVEIPDGNHDMIDMAHRTLLRRAELSRRPFRAARGVGLREGSAGGAREPRPQ